MRVIAGGRGGFITPGVAKEREARKPNPAPYTAEEAKNWFYRAHYDYWWETEMPVNGQSIAALLGKTDKRPHLWSEKVWIQLAGVINLIENRIVCFPIAKDAPPVIHPVVAEHEIVKLCLRHIWTLHARCKSCKGNKFLPVIMNGADHVSCYNCIPPSQYKSIRAKRSDSKIIDEALKKYY